MAVGNLADLVVLDRDPVIGSPFGKTSVDLLSTRGRQDFERGRR